MLESDGTCLLAITRSRCRYASAKLQIQPNIWQKLRRAPWSRHREIHLHTLLCRSFKGSQARCANSRFNGKTEVQVAGLPPKELTLLPRSHVKVKGRSKQNNREGRFYSLPYSQTPLPTLFLLSVQSIHHNPPMIFRWVLS